MQSSCNGFLAMRYMTTMMICNEWYNRLTKGSNSFFSMRSYSHTK